ncbi:putative mitochondrial import inner membrane translocase subunit [Clavispora lusitaniae]|uniref:Mitochondrial import inner membrane translocase subunit Tim21 n=1 Tax=Clavispora lusitaniae TaxID=36911 RepID=A0AA91T0R1_CLALS|nr:putative mitochondrial import inner membrane translocase subunit [Clavispora lusitaniae]
MVLRIGGKNLSGASKRGELRAKFVFLITMLAFRFLRNVLHVNKRQTELLSRKSIKPVFIYPMRPFSLLNFPTSIPPTSKPVSLMNFSRYSTKTAPPPPPPPPADKNARGKAILNRISRIFTFSISSILVVGALGVAGLVVYLILSELFLPSGDTKTFNKAVKLIESNEQAQKALNFNPGERLRAYGEVPGDKWVRNRPVQSVRKKGADGKDHLLMRFHVESNSGKHASVVLEQIDTSFWSSEFAYIALELPSKHRMYIVEPKFSPNEYVPRSSGLGKSNGFLGLKWGPKKD